MRSTLTLPEAKLAELVKLTGAKSKTQAVLIAIDDEIRERKLAKIRELAGKLEFYDAENLRHQDERFG